MDADLKQYLAALEGRLNEHVTTKIQGLGNILETRLETRLAGMENSLERRLVEFENGLGRRLVELDNGLEARLVEKMRDMQTELLRGFAAFSDGQTIRLRKVEVDQSNLDAALSSRLNIVEGRLRQIELRQGIEPPPPPQAHP